MKIKKNGKVIKLSESDLRIITKRYLNENEDDCISCVKKSLGDKHKGKAEKAIDVLFSGGVPSMTDITEFLSDLGNIELSEVMTIGFNLMKCSEKCGKEVMNSTDIFM
jgi:hypothetical protein